MSEEHEQRAQRRVAAADAHQDALARRRAMRVLGGVVVLLAVAVGLLSARSITESGRTDHAVRSAVAQVRQVLDVSCAFYHDLAIVPLQPTSTPALLRIIADARNTYAGFGCAAISGPLPPPDSRVERYLK